MKKYVNMFWKALDLMERLLDYLPVPALFVGDAFLAVALVWSLVVVPLVGPAFLLLVMVAYNRYVLLRVYGVLNFKRIMSGQTLRRKQTLGMTAYEPATRRAFKLIKHFRRQLDYVSAPQWAYDEFAHLVALSDRVRRIAKRLEMIDQLFFTPSLNPQHLERQVMAYSQLASVSSRRQREYSRLALRAQGQLQKSHELMEQRNRLVGRITRFCTLLQEITRVAIREQDGASWLRPELADKLEQVHAEFDNPEAAWTPDAPSGPVLDDSPPDPKDSTN